jgi:hypothetical protein
MLGSSELRNAMFDAEQGYVYEYERRLTRADSASSDIADP